MRAGLPYGEMFEQAIDPSDTLGWLLPSCNPGNADCYFTQSWEDNPDDGRPGVLIAADGGGAFIYPATF